MYFWWYSWIWIFRTFCNHICCRHRYVEDWRKNCLGKSASQCCLCQGQNSWFSPHNDFRTLLYSHTRPGAFVPKILNAQDFTCMAWLCGWSQFMQFSDLQVLPDAHSISRSRFHCSEPCSRWSLDLSCLIPSFTPWISWKSHEKFTQDIL